MANLKVGDKIIFTKDDDVVHAYFVGDKGKIVEICYEDSDNEHYTIIMNCGKKTWADDSEVVLRVKKQKKWLKATPELIAKLEGGDMVKLRNGNKSIVSRVDKEDYRAFVMVENAAWVGAAGLSNIGLAEWDIIKIRNKKYDA